MGKVCDECFGKHYARGKCARHYKMPSQLNPKPIARTTTPIAKVSKKREKLDKVYSVICIQFKKLRPYCEAKLPGCQQTTSDVHHKFFGADRDKYYLDITTWCPVCPHCHHLIHDVLSSDELIAIGLRLKENVS